MNHKPIDQMNMDELIRFSNRLVWLESQVKYYADKSTVLDGNNWPQAIERLMKIKQKVRERHQYLKQNNQNGHKESNPHHT